MNRKEAQNQTVLISMGFEELRRLIEEVVVTALDNHSQQTENIIADELITRKEAAALLAVSLPTLDRLTKDGVVAWLSAWKWNQKVQEIGGIGLS